MRNAMLVVLVLCGVAGGYAEDAEVSLSVDAASAYVFRGATFNDGLVLQPGIEVSKAPVTVGAWGNLDIDDYDNAVTNGQFSEIDLYGSCDLPVPGELVSMSVGYTEYTYPSGGGDADRELSVSGSLDTLLSPSVSVYYGVDGGVEKSVLVEVGMSHEMELGGGLTGSASVSCWYVNPDEGESGLSYSDIGVAVSYGMFSAGLTYTARIDEDVLPDVEDGGSYDTEVVGRIGISRTF